MWALGDMMMNSDHLTSAVPVPDGSGERRRTHCVWGLSVSPQFTKFWQRIEARIELHIIKVIKVRERSFVYPFIVI